jgi:hypothetical protein
MTIGTASQPMQALVEFAKKEKRVRTERGEDISDDRQGVVLW